MYGQMEGQLDWYHLDSACSMLIIRMGINRHWCELHVDMLMCISSFLSPSFLSLILIVMYSVIICCTYIYIHVLLLLCLPFCIINLRSCNPLIGTRSEPVTKNKNFFCSSNERLCKIDHKSSMRGREGRPRGLDGSKPL